QAPAPLAENASLRGHMRSLSRSLFVTLGLATTACAGDSADDPEEAATPDVSAGPTPDPAMELTTACVNRAEGYAVEYPTDWNVYTGALGGPCTLFDPDPIVIPEGSELPIEIAIILGFEPVPLSTLA